jgi:ATPase subunit of ABC transporter with duplicated ATPase domains
VLLLDEPTAALDAEAKEGVERTLAELPCSMVVVTHDRVQADRLAGRVIELNT